MKEKSGEVKLKNLKPKFNITAMSKHFAAICKDCTSSNQVRAKMKTLILPKILWQGDRIKCMKSTNSANCKLCMMERMELIKRFSTNRQEVINTNSDLYSSCTCAANFHSFKIRTKTDTEEGFYPEKSPIKNKLSKPK